jgi:predicted MFS family arabinose efflux permease
MATTIQEIHEPTHERTAAWGVVIAYGLIAAATQMLWLTYAAITTDSAHRYGVSVDAIGWLSEIFPLLYVVLAIPAGVLLDRWFRSALGSGAVLVALGGSLRLGGETFAWALAGQIVIAIAQPVVMSAVGKVAAEYLPVSQRALGIAVGSGAGFAGMLLALLLGPAFGGAHLQALLLVEALMGICAALLMLLQLRRRGAGAQERVAIEGGIARALWARPEIRVLSGLAFLGFGVFVALSTWLQTLLHPDGISDSTAGVLLVGMIVTGVIGCAVIPTRVLERGTERRFMGSVVVVGALGSVALGALPWLGTRAAVLLVMGVFLLPALPVLLTAAEQLAGAAAGTAGAIVWMAGNLGGLVVALLVQVLVHEPLAAFLAMGAVFASAAPLARRMVHGAAIANVELRGVPGSG